jgi:transposase-like protein
MTDKPAILDASGKPARTANDTGCPQCGAGPDKRGPSCGFGVRRPVCTVCGWKWEDEVWRD